MIDRQKTLVIALILVIYFFDNIVPVVGHVFFIVLDAIYFFDVLIFFFPEVIGIFLSFCIGTYVINNPSKNKHSLIFSILCVYSRPQYVLTMFATLGLFVGYFLRTNILYGNACYTFSDVTTSFFGIDCSRTSLIS